MDVDLEQLLRHREFLTALARGLVADPSEQDELLWETMGEGATNPPRHAALKPWLARVMRNRASDRYLAKQRRQAHERASARLTEVESAAELAARFELGHQLARHVRALDPDYRDALLFRFFEGLPPRLIAKRLDLPVETVKTRLRRALALLRARLDQDHGSRDKWLGCLLPLAFPSAKTAGAGLTTLGVLMMAMKTKVALAGLAAVVLLGAATLVAFQMDSQDVALSDPVPQAESDASGATESAVVHEDSSMPREPSRRYPAPGSSDGMTLVVHDPDDNAIAGATVSFQETDQRWVAESAARLLGSTNSEGRISIPRVRLEKTNNKDDLVVHRKGFLPALISRRAVSGAMRQSGVLDVILDTGIEQTFSFRLEDGTPVADQKILLSRCSSFPRSLSGGHPAATFDAIYSAASDGSGAATFSSLKPGQYAFRVLEDDAYGVVLGPGKRGLLSIPCPTPEITLSQVLAGGIVVVGDRVIICNARFIGTSLRNGGTRQLQYLSEKQRKRLNTPLFWAAFRKRTLRPRVRWSVLLERTGVRSGELELKPLTGEGRQPLIINVSPNTPSKPCGQVVIDWPSTKPMPAMVLIGGSTSFREEGIHIRLALQPNTTYRVPIGPYRLEAKFRSVRRILPTQKFDVRQGSLETRRITIPPGFETCTLSLTYPNGNPAKSVSVSFYKEDKEVAGRFLTDEKAISFLLPVGQIVLKAKTPGCKDLQQTLTIQRGRPNTIIARLQWAQ